MQWGRLDNQIETVQVLKDTIQTAEKKEKILLGYRHSVAFVDELRLFPGPSMQVLRQFECQAVIRI